MTTRKTHNGTAYARNPYVQFDEGEVVPAATPRRGSLLYNKLIMIVGAAACLALGAYADGTTLTWNGADGASWEGANWLNGETPSAWVDGANAVFPSAATVALDGAVTVSNLTTSGALTLTSTEQASYDDTFLSKSDSVLIFPGLRLADISAMSATMAGKSIGGGAVSSDVIAQAYHFIVDGTSATAQFQRVRGSNLLCVKVSFTERSDGVYAMADSACYVPGGSAGCDIDSVDVTPYAVTTSRDEHGYGLLNMKAMTSRLTLVGEATFGGKLTANNVAVEVTAPVSQTWGQAISCSNGRLEVKGTSTVEKSFGILDSSVSGTAAAWLTATASDTVFTNMLLSRTVPISGVMRGSWISFNLAVKPYHVKSDGETMTFQLQGFSGGIKGAKVELKQDGMNVTARVLCTYLLSSAYCTNADLGIDLDNTANVSTTTGIKQYGVKSLNLNTVDSPLLKLGGNNSVGDIVVDCANLVFTNYTARPEAVVARNGSQVVYGAEMKYATGYSAGDGCLRRFESGSSFWMQQGLVAEARARFVFDDATLRVPTWHSSYKDGNQYVNELTLANGARVVGNPLRCGYFNATNETHYTSAGAATNTIDTGIALFRHNRTGNMTNVLIVTTYADLIVPGNIFDTTDDGSKGARIVKRGDATLTLSGNNTFAGRLTVEAGTLALGSDTALPASAPLTLAGGTVSCGTTTNATGALTLSGNATINLGDGVLSFADSRGETWANGAILNITGTDKLPTRSLRFGTDGSGLTTAQLKHIRYNGEKVSLDNEGYLSWPKGLIISVF